MSWIGSGGTSNRGSMDNNFEGNVKTLRLYFDDPDKSAYIIKFGKKEHLEQIQNGNIRFTRLSKYREIENQNIGDKYEGVEFILYKDAIRRILFSHPSINNGNQLIIDNLVQSISKFPDNSSYICCMTYFTANDVIQKNIFDEKVLLEKEWDFVLFVLDSINFINNIKQSLLQFSPIFGAVNYVDYSKNQISLNALTKSSVFEWQKEARFVFEYNNENCNNIKRINEQPQGKPCGIDKILRCVFGVTYSVLTIRNIQMTIPRYG